MATTFNSLGKFFSSLHEAVHWLSGMPQAQAQVRAAQSPVAPTPHAGLHLARAASRARPTHPGQPQARAWSGPTRAAVIGQQRPLRVVRVMDGRHACSYAGRMVISGRLADVCAELDRLAAIETSSA